MDESRNAVMQAVKGAKSRKRLEAANLGEAVVRAGHGTRLVAGSCEQGMRRGAVKQLGQYYYMRVAKGLGRDSPTGSGEWSL